MEDIDQYLEKHGFPLIGKIEKKLEEKGIRKEYGPPLLMLIARNHYYWAADSPGSSGEPRQEEKGHVQEQREKEDKWKQEPISTDQIARLKMHLNGKGRERITELVLRKLTKGEAHDILNEIFAGGK